MIKVVEDSSFVEKAVLYIKNIVDEREKGKPFHVFCSGGSTPKPIYTGLARAVSDWSLVHFWQGDERYVPWDHPDSNFAMLSECLLKPARIASSQAHPWPILASPQLSADTYQTELKRVFQQEGQSLNLQILGMGSDGHTASLFPDSQALKEKEALCVANLVQAQEQHRLTLTFPALALSQQVLFLIKGADKANTLKEVVEEHKHPAARVRGRISTTYFIDRAAASMLDLASKG